MALDMAQPARERHRRIDDGTECNSMSEATFTIQLDLSQLHRAPNGATVVCRTGVVHRHHWRRLTMAPARRFTLPAIYRRRSDARTAALRAGMERLGRLSAPASRIRACARGLDDGTGPRSMPAAIRPRGQCQSGIAKWNGSAWGPGGIGGLWRGCRRSRACRSTTTVRPPRLCLRRVHPRLTLSLRTTSHGGTALRTAPGRGLMRTRGR
jgi:hypothetical protein